MNWGLLLFQLLWVFETYNDGPVIVSWLHIITQAKSRWWVALAAP